MGSLLLPQLCCCVWYKSCQRQYVNKWVWLYSSRTLFMESKIWISDNFHLPWHNSLLIFKNHTYLAHDSHTKAGGWPELAWRLTPSFRATTKTTKQRQLTSQQKKYKGTKCTRSKRRQNKETTGKEEMSQVENWK